MPTPPDERAFVRRLGAFREITSLLRDDPEPPPIGRTRAEKSARVESLLVWALREREKPPRRRKTPLWPGTARAYAAIANDAEKLAGRVQLALPAYYTSIHEALEILAIVGRDVAAAKRRKRPRKKPGRPLDPTTELLAVLDVELQEIRATRRRALIASIVRETLGIDVRSAEAVRVRLVDYRLKPGRSPKSRPPQ
jgi:hypothetical protein